MVTINGKRYGDFTFEVRAKRFDNDYNTEDTINFLSHIAYILSCAHDYHSEHGYIHSAEADWDEMEAITEVTDELENQDPEQELLEQWKVLLA